MPVNVQIPLKIAIDPALSGSALSGQLRGAVASGVGRALAELDREVIAPRGGYAWPSYAAPDITWSLGAGADAMPADDWRADVENDIMLALQAAVTAAPATHTKALDDAPEAVPNAPSEPFDARRLDGDGKYRVHSYDTDLPSPSAPISLEYFNENTQWHTTHRTAIWYFSGTRSQFIQLMQAHLAHHVTPRPRAGQVFGLLYRADGKYQIAIISINRVTDDAVYFDITRQFSPGDRMNIVNSDDGSRRGGTLGKRPWMDLEKLWRFTSRDDLADRQYVRFCGIRNVTQNPVSGETQDVAEHRALLRRLAEEDANQAYNGTGRSGPQQAAELDGSFCIIPNDAFSGQSLRLLPIWRVIEKSDAEDGDGGEPPAHPSEAGGENAGAGRSGGDGDETGGGGGSDMAEPGTQHGAGQSSRFPMTIGGETITLDLAPFEGEPSFDDLGALGDRLRILMGQIAFRLEMPTGEYPASFIIAAGQVLGGRASAVGQYAARTPAATNVRNTAPGAGNLGDVDMGATDSPSIRVLRFLAATTPLMTQFERILHDIIGLPDVTALIEGRHAGQYPAWGLAFYKTYTPIITASGSQMFLRACQIKMLEALRASQVAIETRLNRFDDYYATVRTMLLSFVSTQTELQALRDRLAEEDPSVSSFSAGVSAVYSTWSSAREALSLSMSDHYLNRNFLTETQVDGQIVREGNTVKIRDDSGRDWTLAELDEAIAFRTRTATSADPLVNHFRDIPEVVETFRQRPESAYHYLRSLLTEMQSDNADMQRTTQSSVNFAFRAGKIREDLPNRTVPGTAVALQGIHLLAHEAIGDAFLGDKIYGMGIDQLMDFELGLQGLILFGETVSVLALAVICPPAAAVLGAVYAGAHYYHASQMSTLYNALLDPDGILNKAEVEFDLFLAEFEIVLSVIPEAGPLLRGGSFAGKTVLRSGVRQGGRIIARRARRELLVSVGRQLKRGLAQSVVTAVLTDRAMALALPHLIGPVFAEVNAAISRSSGMPPPPPVPTGPAPEDISGPEEPALIRRLEEYDDTLHFDDSTHSGLEDGE
ncbi:hypothetical protein L0664_15865 [Octadecabacter sp. G9-8]|uniref:Uncharacterized protein n=1 Tax=Octadecabacter dasysiphoniae TaxID=2909341 RepID=A0ABS9D2L5_9RHOB|nr:hypothetical protein [Octadecabacter dasysiphoniae]MCF2872553.1 hypothetical protein [Octadecabacter dasysiphoniae]